DGQYLGGWGGSDQAKDIDGINQWPSNVHGIYVDRNDTVWLAGNGEGDHVVLNFDSDGNFIRQYGRRNETGGNSNQELLGNPADIVHDTESNETFVADGYINKRIISFKNSDQGEPSASRIFGAYGASPQGGTREGSFDQSQASSNSDGGANPQSQSFGDIVHCINKGRDSRIYVCDRRNNRIQVFEANSDGTTDFVEDIIIAPETGGTRTASDIAWSPDGLFLYIADMMNGRIWILDAETYEFLGAVGRNGRYPGEFIWLHSVDVDSDGNLYTTEVNTGRRVQKFLLMNVE
ncbi:MAG: beta-propeller fold lactonase family protein, partial [Pseudomonadota bacterium]